jgi:2-dehydro-3-deoxyphosphogluconate aldolase/(4S)-4-hydroxy-2-oxoglutarate aldolase
MQPIDQILVNKIVAIVRLDEYARAVDVARALANGGVFVLEFTLTGTGAIDAIGAVREALGDAVCVGVGTALHADDAHAAIDAGAQFVVTPAVRPKVISACVNRNTLVLAGGFTPTELLNAHEAGSQLVKLFPAQAGGPRYVKDVLAPLPFLRLVPTGGVSADNAREYLNAGAVAVGMGGNLVSNKLVAAEAWEQISATARASVASVQG